MAGLGFGEMAPSPEENKKEKVYFGVSGVEDIAVEAFSRAAERTAETAVVPEASVEKLVSENKERTELTAERSERPETYTHRLNEKGKAYPESEAHLEKEAAALRPDLEKMPETEREKIGVALRNLGFYAEEKKNLFFAGVFNKLAAVDKDKRGGVITKFVEKLENQFEKDAEKARERIETVEKTKNRETLANAGYLFGNLMKYGRTIADVAGWTVAAPLRYVMMAGMAFARGAEAMKEVRFENEKVVEKTRIEDADKAAGEGFKIYEAAKVRAGARKVSARDLDKAYREYLPHDLLERLYCKTPEQPSLVNRVVQGILRTHIEISVGLLGSKIEGIEENKKLSPEEKKIKRERLFHRFERRLRDYDRVVGQFGTVDVFAMGARYAEIAGKAAVGVATAETLFLSLDRVLGGKIVEFLDGQDKKDVLDDLPEKIAIAKPPVLEQDSIDSIEVDSATRQEYPTGAAPDLQEQIHINLKEHAEIGKENPLLESEIEQEIPRPASVELEGNLIELATVRKGEGVTHAILRQLKADPRTFGYSPESGVDLDAWAVLKAKAVAIENHYLKPDGSEIRVFDRGLKGNPAYVLKMDASGKFNVVEYIEGKSTAGESVKNPYEYEWKKPQAPGVEKEISARNAFEAIQEKKIPTLPLERIPVEELRDMKIPEWLAARAVYTDLLETLPEKTVALEEVRESFEEFSLDGQEEIIKELAHLEEELAHLGSHSKILNLTSSQSEYLLMTKGLIEDMRDMFADAQENFREQVEDVGVNWTSYEKAIAEKGVTVKALFNMQKTEVLDEKRWGAFVRWIRALNPTHKEENMKVHDFLRSLTARNFR